MNNKYYIDPLSGDDGFDGRSEKRQKGIMNN